MGVTGPDQDIIIARSTMELWVGSKNISPYFTWVYDATVADFQVLVRCYLHVLGQLNSQKINFTGIRNIFPNLINRIKLNILVKVI